MVQRIDVDVVIVILPTKTCVEVSHLFRLSSLIVKGKLGLFNSTTALKLEVILNGSICGCAVAQW